MTPHQDQAFASIAYRKFLARKYCRSGISILCLSVSLSANESYTSCGLPNFNAHAAACGGLDEQSSGGTASDWRDVWQHGCRLKNVKEYRMEWRKSVEE